MPRLQESRSHTDGYEWTANPHTFMDQFSLLEDFVGQVESLWMAFYRKSVEKTEHHFLTLYTGSGMGKTRWGREALGLLKETLKTSKSNNNNKNSDIIKFSIFFFFFVCLAAFLHLFCLKSIFYYYY